MYSICTRTAYDIENTYQWQRVQKILAQQQAKNVDS